MPEVAGTAAAETAPARPRTVRIALVLCWAKLAAGLLHAAATQLFTQQADSTIVLAQSFGVVAAAGINLLLFYGYGWIRHVWSLSFVSFLFMISFNVVSVFEFSMASNIEMVASLIVSAVALILLYLRPSRAWFRDMRARRRRART